MQKKDFILLFSVLALAVISRWIPHPPNFTPIASLALFSGVFFTDKRLAFGVPLLVLLISDAVLGFYPILFFVYLGFTCTVLIGFWLRDHLKLAPTVLTVLTSSILFFVLTNLGVWMTSSFYPHTIAGLIECYVAAIPFFQNSVLGNLFYSFIFMGAFQLTQKTWRQTGHSI